MPSHDDMSVAEDTCERIASDPYARLLGIKLLELRPGYARVSLEISPDMVNFHGMTHGGVIFSLADAAFAAASNSHGRVAVALNVNINFLSATTAGARLEATGREEKLGNRTALYRMTVTNENGELVALADGLVYRK